MEVARRHHVVVDDHRVVDHGAELDLDDAAHVGQHVAHRTVHLRRAPQAVRILHRMPRLAMRGQEWRPGQQGAQVGRARQLSLMRAQRLHAFVEIAGEQLGVGQRQREQRLHRLGAIEQRKPLLGPERQWSKAGLLEQLSRRSAGQVRAALVTQATLADQRQREMCELRQVAGGAD